MGSRRLTLVLALLLVLLACGLGAWLLLQPQDAVETAANEPPAVPLAGTATEEPALTAPEPARAGKQEGNARTSLRAEAATQAPFPLENAHWVDVRVVMPPLTPLDEELVVVGGSPGQDFGQVSPEVSRHWFARADRHPGMLRCFEAPRGEDGSFRVAFAADATRAFLDLRAHYLYLPQPIEVSLPPAGPLTLEPALGGRLIARFELPVTLPEDFVPQEVQNGVLQLFAWSQGGENHQTSAQLGSQLAPDLGGLRPGLSYFLRADIPGLVDVLEGSLSFEAGRTLERRYPLRVGARLRGRVVAEADGVPVEKAQVSAAGAEAAGVFLGGSESSLTDAEGRFDLRGVTPGKTMVNAQGEGFLRSKPQELELSDLQVVEGLVLGLPSGERVSGRVTFPDGRPAVEARVELEEKVSTEGEGEIWVSNQAHDAETDADGRFWIGGLGAGPFEVRVEVQVVTDEPAGERVHLNRVETWRARAENVAAGADLALVLDPPIVVTGRAVDDTGAPLTRFRVRVGDVQREEVPWRVVTSGPGAGPEIESEDGSFVLRTLGRGTWRMALEADGHGASQERTVTLPGDTGPFTFVLPRAGLLAGRVLYPSGAPAAGAKVLFGRSVAGSIGMSESSDMQADAEGLFRIENVEPGAVELSATLDGFAPSPTLALEVRPAEPLEGLELALRIGGTLTGEVYRPDGSAAAGREVTVEQPPEGQSGGTVETDLAGRFTLEHLEPGLYQVAVFPDLDLAQGEDPDPVAMLEELRMTTAEIRDGEVTHVVLGAPPAAPVELTGVVREAGRGAGQMFVMALFEGSALLSSLKSARTAPDGSFAMTLPSSGDWVLMVGEDVDGEGSEFPLTVPPGESHHVELDLPTGRISGRVLAPDGAPAQGAQVSLAGSSVVSMLRNSGGRETRADEDGRFAFQRLRPGAYDLRAGGEGLVVPTGGAGGWANAVLSNLELGAGGALDGLELRLAEPGTLRGVVRKSDGSPASSASVWVRDAAGRLLFTRSWCTTDAAGRFTFRDAGSGRHTVFARSETEASAEVPVEIRAGAESEVELMLQPGTLLLVAVEDDEGNALRAHLRVFDEAGREVSGLSSGRDLERLMSEGFSTREQKIGPLAPGRYRVEAVTEDGLRAAEAVSLTGQPERRLRLRE